jgi:hypothetical protein
MSNLNSMIEDSAHQFINQSELSVGASNNMQSSGILHTEGSPKNDGKDIHGFYKFLFESDLKTAKDRTMTQLESMKSLADFNLKESEVLRLEN